MNNEELKPCPFCGGKDTMIQYNGRVWNGSSFNAPVSVSIIHWCENVQGPSRPIERIGADEKSAFAAWNTRHFDRISKKMTAAEYLEMLDAEGVR